MAQLRRPISSLLNGVSQQAPSLRLPSQCEAQVNGHPSLADGLVKRPASQHVAKLTATVMTDAHVTTMNWASDEQFVLVIVDGDLFVYDMDGVSKTVNFPHGKTYLTITGTAENNFATVTVEDVTYIVNRETQVAQTATTAGGTYQGKKQDFASLPGSPTNGDTWLIVGDGTVAAQGFYMQWNSTTSVWEESANPGDLIELDATTMPHKLTYNSGTGQFTFAKETWTNRAAGDAVTVPDPSFIDRKIRDIFFHRNRLGVLAGEYCVLSESGPNYTNFFGKSAAAVQDNDRIDVRAANIRVSKLNFALPFNRQLAVQSDSSQFILSTALGQALTPSTVSIDLATSYAANAEAKPVAAGNSLFFPSEDGSYASVREYSVSTDSEIVNTADDLSQHLPKYIPSGVYKMALAEDDDTLFLVTTAEPNRIYAYKFYYSGGEQAQAAWSYWEFDAEGTILNIETLESNLYIVVARTDGTHLLRVNLAIDESVADVGFPVLLDYRVLLTGVYDAPSDTTTWTLPYVNTGTSDIVVIKDGGWAGNGSLVQGTSQPTTGTVEVDGDYSSSDVYIGLPYEFRFKFSEQFVRQSQDNETGSPILNGVLHLRNFAVRYNDTGYIRAEVQTRPGGTTFQYVYGGKTLGSIELVLGTPNIDTGTFKFPVVANSQNVSIELVNDTHVPSALVSAEWTGNFTSKRGA